MRALQLIGWKQTPELRDVADPEPGGAQIVRQLGHLTLVGIGGGTLPLSFFSIPYEAGVATTYWGSVTELMEVIALAEAQRITTRVTRYPLADALEAYEAMRSGDLVGRAVIVPS